MKQPEFRAAPNPERRPIAAALGLFDGVHLGHGRVPCGHVRFGDHAAEAGTPAAIYLSR